MSLRTSRLPSRFPVGTRHIIEGRGGRIHVQYLELPDGRQIDLPVRSSSRKRAVRSRATRAISGKRAGKRR